MKKRVKFLEWLDQRILNEAGRGLYGGDEGNEKPKFNLGARIGDNEIAEGDWEMALEYMNHRWALAEDEGYVKDLMKHVIDKYARFLVSIGNDPDRVYSIVNRTVHDGRSGSYIKAATRNKMSPRMRMLMQPQMQQRAYNELLATLHDQDGPNVLDQSDLHLFLPNMNLTV